MNYRVQRKNLELFRQLQSKGYTTSLIFKDDEIQYVTLEINKRKIFLSYWLYSNFKMICDVGQLDENKSIGCTYGFFNKLPNNIVSEYINSLDIENISNDDKYIRDTTKYIQVFNEWLKENDYTEAYDFK